MVKIIKYALRSISTGELLGFSARGNEDAECCSSVYYELEGGSEQIWYADSAEHAEFVRKNSTAWYNADYQAPKHGHGIFPEDIEVVRIEISVENEAANVVVPDDIEYYSDFLVHMRRSRKII